MESKQNFNTNLEDGMTIQEFLKLFWKNKIIVILITVIFTIVAAAYSMTQPKIYKTTVTFIEDNKSQDNIGSLSKILGDIPINAGVSSNKVEKILIFLNSRKLKYKIIDKLSLVQYYSKYYTKGKETTKDRVCKWLEKLVSFSRNDKTGLYSISVEMQDKKTAVILANTYFLELEDFIKNEITGDKKSRLISVKQNIDTLEKDIKTKEGSLTDIEKRYNIVSLEEDTKIVVGQITELKKTILSLNSQLSTATVFYGPKSYEVQKLTKQIEEATKQVNEIETGKSKNIKLISLQEIQNIKLNVEKLRREIDSSNNMYEIMKTEYEALKLEIVKEQNLVTLIDDAVEPTEPIKPNRKIIVLMGFILGIMCSAIIILFKGDKK